ncbi:chloride channel protein, CIC family [Desulfurobacterium pacificum]|uniref:Chloride channel protein, CIC family n=1 Tax=Desulfurobacterium pacificum TaxID=240166 RepID=A0ABY1NWM8_9BACT|nr:chloride channel protein [Desulfurobacterium pacificum]SMP19590.1 chloride channel protein, CIC family [Desulfurobacterium pacificum]
MRKLNVLFFSSLITGVVTGFFVSVYVLMSKVFSFIFFQGDPIETIPHLPLWYLIFVPTAVILFVNYLIERNDRVREYGLREIAQAIADNRITYTFGDLILKIIASALCIGSGFAVGNEGPSAAIGAMISSRFHRLFNLPKELTKVSIGIGAGSGISAVFVSPITGILFAVENVAYFLVKDFIGFLIVGSFSAFLVALHFLMPVVFKYSAGKLFQTDYLIAVMLFIPLITSSIYLYLTLRDRVMFFLSSFLERKVPRSYRIPLISVTSGIVIGLLLKVSPYAAFSGHEVVVALMNSKYHFPLFLIFLLAVLRIVANAVSLYANAVGGLFITLMSIGSLVGYGFGEIMRSFGFSTEPFYFAAIGAAVFVGVVMKVPFTSVVLALEITYDYNVVVPVGFIVAVSSLLTGMIFDVRKLVLKGFKRKVK